MLSVILCGVLLYFIVLYYTVLSVLHCSTLPPSINPFAVNNNNNNNMDDENLMPKEQKGCFSGSKGCKDQLLISKTILQEFKLRKKNCLWHELSESFRQCATQLDNQIPRVNWDQ